MTGAGLMRYSPSEKMDIIHTVERSAISVRRTLNSIGLSRSTFYHWYRRYQGYGFDGLRTKRRRQRYYWNRIPDEHRDVVLATARASPEKSCREIACHSDLPPNFRSSVIMDFAGQHRRGRDPKNEIHAGTDYQQVAPGRGSRVTGKFG